MGDSPPLNPMDTFLDDLPQPAVDIADTVHGEVTEFNLPTLSSPLVLLQDVGPGCGGKTWPAGEVLANYMIRKYKGTEDLKGKTIIELGSGTGLAFYVFKLINRLVGLAMAKEVDVGTGMIYITDQENMIDIMSANINLNNLISRIEACELDWSGPIPDHLVSPDIVLAADCVYFEPAFPLLHATLLKLTEHGNVELYMAYKKRRKADRRFFQRIKKDFEIIEVLDDIDRDAYHKDSVFLYRFIRKHRILQVIE